MKNIIIVTLLFAMGTVAAYGFNYRFLFDTARSYYSKEDWKIYQKAQIKVLNNFPNGKKLVWKNYNTGSKGSFVALKAKKVNGFNCRNLKIAMSANFRLDKATLKFCKVNGVWKGF